MELNMNDIFSAVKRQDIPALLSLFSGGRANVSLPSYGTVSNNRVFSMLVEKTALLFQELELSARHVGTLRGEGVLMAEYQLEYQFYDEERDKNLLYAIPTALVCDLDGGGLAVCVTVYTGMEYLVGKEVIRPAFRNGDLALWEKLPASVRDCYEAAKSQTLTEPCRVLPMGDCICVEENVLMTQGAVCTPQAHLSVFDLAPDGSVADRREYGEVVWDFKLWPVLY